MVANGFQEVDIVRRIDGHTPELREVEKHLAHAAHPVLLA